jgi:hypothetical protein
MLSRGDGPGPGETPAGIPILMFLKFKSLVAIRNQRNSTNVFRRHNSERRPMMQSNWAAKNRRWRYNFYHSTYLGTIPVSCPPISVPVP